jgi:hypothetical protein
VVVTWDRLVGVMVGRIAAVVVVIVIGVVVRIHRRHVVRVWTMARRRWWHHRAIAVVVVAVVARTVIVTRARTDVDDHPRLVAIAMPAEAHWLEVLKRGEAVELVTQFVVRHHRVSPGRIGTVSGDADGDSLDSTGADPHILPSIAIAVVGIEVEVDVTSVCVVSNILNIIVDGNRIGVVGQHGL